MKNKCTQSTTSPQHLIAGLLPGDNDIEFFCVSTAKKSIQTKWIQNGKTKNWNELPVREYVSCMNHFNNNLRARTALKNYEENGVKVSRNRLVEIYIALGWGTADGKPDMIDGVLQEMENFRLTRNCLSLAFKDIKIHGKPLKPRELFMLDEMASDADPTDHTIAALMGKSVSTFNQQSRQLREKVGVNSKHALLMVATRQGAVQQFNNRI